MAKLFAVILAIAFIQIEAGDAFSIEWSNTFRAINDERLKISYMVRSIAQKTSMDINLVAVGASKELNLIKSGAEFQKTQCSIQILRDIDIFYQSMQQINMCRNNQKLNLLKEKYMRQLEAQYELMNQCNNKPTCSAETINTVSENLSAMQENYQPEFEAISAENTACVETQKTRINEEVEDLKTRWDECNVDEV